MNSVSWVTADIGSTADAAVLQLRASWITTHVGILFLQLRPTFQRLVAGKTPLESCQAAASGVDKDEAQAGGPNDVLGFAALWASTPEPRSDRLYCTATLFFGPRLLDGNGLVGVANASNGTHTNASNGTHTSFELQLQAAVA